MKKGAQVQKHFYPKARQAGLNIQELPDETLIFDTENDQANCLNATAALVWKHADGTRSVSDIAREMSQTLNAPVDTRVVWYALEQLSNKKLLQEPGPIPNEYDKMSRRAFLSKVGIVGAAVAIPVIVSIVAPSPAHAQSGCAGGACVTTADCCPTFVCCGVTCETECV